ncbi:MAG: nitroreductase family protein [Lachnospiraceae bacterium]
MGIIESRRSIRNFQEKKIPKEVLLQIVKAGMHAPNAYGKSLGVPRLTEKRTS